MLRRRKWTTSEDEGGTTLSRIFPEEGFLTTREADANGSAALHGAANFVHRFRDDNIDAEVAELGA